MRYTVTVTFLGDIDEAPESWWKDTYIRASQHIQKGKTSGKVYLYKDDKVYQSFWELKEDGLTKQEYGE